MYDEGTFSHPFFLGGYFILTGAVFSAVLIGSGMWLAWMAGYRRRNLCGDHSDYLVTRLPRPAQHWTIADFFLMFGTIIVVGSLASPLLNKPIAPTVGQATEVAPAEQASNPEAIEPVESAQQPGVLPNQAGVPPVKMDLAKRVGIQMLANATSFLILLAFLHLARDATLENLSLIPRLSDLRRGLVATVWILAPVLLVNIAVSQLVEYKHSVTDLLAEKNSMRTFAALFLSAAVLTPIVEEFQFRLLLQGGLQKYFGDTSWQDDHPRFSYSSLAPLLVSSLVFAVMHLGQGAAPIPLFFLALGLGVVYQRTNRLWITIVVHMILNGATITMEFCRLNSGFGG